MGEAEKRSKQIDFVYPYSYVVYTVFVVLFVYYIVCIKFLRPDPLFLPVLLYASIVIVWCAI